MIKSTLFSLLLFGLTLFNQSRLSCATLPPFPQEVINHMATREMRYHHYLWHQVRDNWNNFPNATKDAFIEIGWAPPNPARNFDPITGEASAILDNYSGEEFLYMHRQMIATANDLIAQYQPSYGKIEGWKTLPAPDDPDYPVPMSYTVPNSDGTTTSTMNRKTDSFYTNTIVTGEKLFKNPDKLRNMTLAELGARMEATIHSYLHMRFSESTPLGFRETYQGVIPMIDKMWDNVTYNWLGDTYSSHVNPVFWKIHGWVDDRIEDWRVANNLTSIIWKGTWTGGPMENLDSVLKVKQSGAALRGTSSSMSGMNMSADAVGSVMHKALEIFLKSGVKETGPADEVILPPLWQEEDDSIEVNGDP